MVKLCRTGVSYPSIIEPGVRVLPRRLSLLIGACGFPEGADVRLFTFGVRSKVVGSSVSVLIKISYRIKSCTLPGGCILALVTGQYNCGLQWPADCYVRRNIRYRG